MASRFWASCLLFISPLVWAENGFISYFKTEDGRTNWQYIANFSSGVLIILLSISALILLLIWRKAWHANRELTAIRNELELRVEQRTAELRASETYIQNILRSLPLMLVGLDRSGKITHWNQRAEEIAGIPMEEALGHDLWQIYPTISIAPDQIRQALDQNQTLYFKQNQSGLYYFNITIYPLQDQSEAGVVLLIDDVTQKIIAENMLIHNDKMATMGELAATMAHDINAPLQAILFDLSSYQSLLEKSTLMNDESQCNREVMRLSTLLTDASEKGRQVAAIINNLLNFARRRSDEKQAAQLPEVMEHAIELARDVLNLPDQPAFRDIQIERNYQANLPPIPCYVIELQQAFLNLLRHAYEALIACPRDITPTLRISMQEYYDQAIWIKIEHNGLGLNHEEQMSLFEPFFSQDQQGEPDDAHKRLSFPYFIITEQHQGHMAVTSDVNSGTTFHMQIGR
ncbi:two-component system sensor histidine kinase NtrB [Nitrincola tapanii]|uniref:histidine kinase n=1 Tax=Nitrincola tapanii TaxID=1708751 RepID=A0A5A9W4X8_9GAMM|nr:PAS domain S-box protein [Nitrincola tapanii]KAA0875139.1 PAS domain S-box protein [Nitrincola tapanii]